MNIIKNTVVKVSFTLSDAQGNLIQDDDESLIYLHGGYEGTFPKIEEALEGKHKGYETLIQLEPGDAFGEYNAELLKVESRALFPECLEVGMQFERFFDDEDNSNEPIVYSVTDIAENKVVLDGNHPFAGLALRFKLKVMSVRAATEEEIKHQHVHGIDNNFGIEVVDKTKINGNDEAVSRGNYTLH